MKIRWKTLLCSSLILLSQSVMSAKLAIVIDDFGYRKHNEEAILKLPTEISIAILPDSPLRDEMANKAASQGRDILIHLPMAPISKQPLEKNTLTPQMSAQEIERIIERAIAKIPQAKGMNNHMGSAMTSDLTAMKHVMQTLQHHQFFFLDSVTIGRTQATQAASQTHVNVIKRNVFLDDSQKEADIERQFDRAVSIARKRGYAIAIGHPHPNTVRVLQRRIPLLPADVELVSISSLAKGVPVSQWHATEISSSSLHKRLKPCPIKVPDDLIIPSTPYLLWQTLKEKVTITLMTNHQKSLERQSAASTDTP